MPETKDMKAEKRERPTIDQAYEELFRLGFVVHAAPDDTRSLEQPSVYKTVDTFVTYGAYEDPI